MYVNAHTISLPARIWPIKKGQMELWRLDVRCCCCFSAWSLCILMLVCTRCIAKHKLQCNPINARAAESKMLIYDRTNHCWSPSFDFRSMCGFVFALLRFDATIFFCFYFDWSGHRNALPCNCFVCACVCPLLSISIVVVVWSLLCASFWYPATGCWANLP